MSCRVDVLREGAVDDGQLIDLGVLPGDTALWAVNDCNQAVGWCEFAGFDADPRSSAINERGQIVGISVDHNLAARTRSGARTAPWSPSRSPTRIRVTHAAPSSST